MLFILYIQFNKIKKLNKHKCNNIAFKAVNKIFKGINMTIHMMKIARRLSFFIFTQTVAVCVCNFVAKGARQMHSVRSSHPTTMMPPSAAHFNNKIKKGTRTHRTPPADADSLVESSRRGI